ncbi:MAG: hypothetical protein IJM06_02865, partial [Firmicutes bacterium]|nr:hypothetical protein [Bacillota bacterium]
QYFTSFYADYKNRLDRYFNMLLDDKKRYDNEIYSQPIKTQGMGFDLYTNSARHAATYAVMDKLEHDRQYKKGLENQKFWHDFHMDSAMKSGAESVFKDVQNSYKHLENNVMSRIK